MEKSIVLRLAVLLGFLAFSRCEERQIRIKIDGQDVHRNAFYTDKGSVRLSCLPPKDSSSNTDIYKELAIYKGNVTKDSAAACKGNDPGCTLSLSEPSLSMDISKSNLYTCRFDKAPEPPVDPATVHVYFKQNEIQAFDEKDQPVRPEAIRVTNETSYRLVCPNPQNNSVVHWYRNERELKFDHGNPHYELNDTNKNLTFKKTKTPDASKYGGYYRCERVSQNGARLATAFIKINSPAYVSAAQKSYNKMEGESATLSCHVDGEPVPKVTWRRGDKVLGTDPEEKRVSFSSFEGIANASVTISNLVAEDYGDYVCVAVGPDGSQAEAPTLLRVRSKLAALWPFLGIVAEVIILVAVIFIYERRRAKKEQEENEDAADQKKSLTASNNENKDVRQRKA